MKCVKGYEIKPMRSAAGWYMGTCTEEGAPNCRITNRYYKNASEAAENMFMDYRYCLENEYCNNGQGCIGVEDENQTE